jgi:OmpA-OmpF porin, OOP family
MKSIFCLFGAAFLIMYPQNSSAQILNPKKLLQRKTVDKTNQVLNKKADQVVDSVFDVKSKSQKDDSKPVQQNDKKEETANTQPVNEQPTLQSYSKFDFIPGEKILFFDDFSNTETGDFPAAWNTNGSGEVVTTNLFPGKWLQYASRHCIWTDDLLRLPENYTIEFDIVPIKGEEGSMTGWECRLIQAMNPKAWDGGSRPGKAGMAFGVEYYGRPYSNTYINGDEGNGLELSSYKDDKAYWQKLNEKYHIAIWVQKARVRIYQNEAKLFDFPKAFPVASVKLDRLRYDEGAAMITNVRIAVGNPDTRSKLLTEGKLVSYGIYFDVNKDVVKPESYGTLKEIAAVLNENPDVRIKIVGHTDADGADATNLDLSKRRAASVKNELVKTFGIDESRIETDGKGETQPVATNDTPSNKALNRRVEFIKL